MRRIQYNKAIKSKKRHCTRVQSWCLVESAAALAVLVLVLCPQQSQKNIVFKKVENGKVLKVR